MPKKKMYVEWNDNASLSNSKKKPGNYSPLTRDLDNNLGHVTLSDIDEDTDNKDSDFLDWAAEVLTQVIVELTVRASGHAYRSAKPRVSQWWNETARPSIKSTRHNATRRLSNVRSIRSERRNSSDNANSNRMLNGDNEAIEAEPIRMDAHEAQQRLAAALIARAFSDQQLQVLLNAQVENGEESIEMLVNQLPVDTIEQHVNRMLNTRTTLHSDLLDVFWNQQRLGGSALPVLIEADKTETFSDSIPEIPNRPQT
jgi:hypothetical protein